MVGTTPLGFMSRYHFWSLPPYCSPTFSRSYFSPHSSAHHSTFMTLIELARPQIFIFASPSMATFPFGLGVVDTQNQAACRIAGIEHGSAEQPVFGSRRHAI